MIAPLTHPAAHSPLMKRLRDHRIRVTVPPMRPPLLLALFVLLAVGAEAAGTPAAPAPVEASSEMEAVIIPAELDAARLARAIFAETNRVRRELKLPEFEASEAADDAAAIQAALGWLPGQAPHTNPFHGVSTLPERIERVGLKAARAGENAARLPVIDTHGHNQFGIRVENGVKTPIDIRTGETLAPHTYASFARDIVYRWMNSPGHRANIIHRTYRVLGVAVHLTRPHEDFEQVFAVQVFIAPRPTGRKRIE